MRKHHYPRNRKTPKRHSVKKHRRAGKSVRKYSRGQGKSKSPNRYVTRRIVKKSSGVTSIKRRRALLRTIPKSFKGKARIREAIERLQKIQFSRTSTRQEKLNANADINHFTEKLQGFQNPVFSPAQKAMAIKQMQENTYIGRSVDFTFRDFEKAHRAAEEELISGSKLVNIENVRDHMRRRFGFIDTAHGSGTLTEVA